MPHITIEHSANLARHHDVQALVAAVHHAALDHGLPPLAGLRTRAAERTHYVIADGQPTHAFVAIHVRIGPGRDAAAKSSFLEAILDTAESTLRGKPSPLAIAFSAEITELDPEFRVNRNHIRPLLQAPEPTEGAS